MDHALWLLNLASLLIIGAGWLTSVSVFWQVIGRKIPLDALSIGFFCGSLLMTIPAARSLGKVELSLWRGYAWVLKFYLATTLTITTTSIIAVYVLKDATFASRALTIMQALFGERFVAYTAFDMLAIGSLVGVYCIKRLLKGSLGPSHVSLGEVLEASGDARRHAPLTIAPHLRDRIKSWLAAVGAAALYTMPILPSLGPTLLLYARRYRQNSADLQLSVDKRPPTVLLRSFRSDLADDMNAGTTVIAGMALEPRIDRYFSAFGPFVAIGDPRESIARLGAARARRDGEDWRVTVREWMSVAQVIVMIAGATKSVLWELEQCIVGQHVSKLIILFDEPSAWSASQRLDHIRQAFEATIWRAALHELPPASTLRALCFGANGHITSVVSTTAHYTEATHLAAVMAHHIVRAARPSPPIR
jgi:hypothetical protein